MPPTDVPQQPELSRRIRAARGYAALTQPELAGLLQVSIGYLRQVEGGKQLKPVQARGLIERVAEVCELPTAFLTADFAQLDPGYQPPEDKLASLEATVRALMAQLDELATQASFQLADGSEKLERFGAIIEQSRLLDAEPPNRADALDLLQQALADLGLAPNPSTAEVPEGEPDTGRQGGSAEGGAA